ncbi:MAG: mitochondrial carrier domain-containing protein [Benniella sp.]|nr:MAG: mitochondrial carrier domain-containing protein [Benniella sp.]
MTYELPPIGHALSGGVAAALANVVIYPLDMATTRVQSQSTKEPHHSSSSSERKEILPIEFKRPEPDTPSSSSSSSSSTSSTATTSDVSLSEDGRKKVTKITKTTTVTTTTRTLSGATGSKEKIRYTSVVDAIRKTYRSEGFLALYSGLGSDTVATLMSNFVYFYIYMALRQYKEHRRKSGQLSTVQELFLGAEAGIISRLFTNPIHVITTRQQVMGKELQQQKEQAGATATAAGGKGKAKTEDTTKISARAIIRDIYTQDGILGFWAGYAPTVILSINPSITYFLFETIKKTIVTRQTQALLAKDKSPAKSALAAASALTSLQIFFISACSKAIASFLTYPLILTKTKLQAKSEDDEEEEDSGKEGAKDEEAAIGNNDNNTSTAESQTTKKAKKFTGISDVIRTVVKDKGIAGLYTGCQGQVVKGFFSFGLMYMIKDRVVAWMLALFLAVHNMRNRVTSS